MPIQLALADGLHFTTPGKPRYFNGLLGFASGLLWFMDGMPIPADKLVFIVYPLDGTVLVVGVALCLCLSRGRAVSTTTRGFASPKVTFSIADLLLLTFVCSLVISTILWIPPSLAEYEYDYDFGDTLRSSIVFALLAVSATGIVFHLSRAPEFSVRNLTLTIGLTIIGGVLTAWLLGIRANPLWASYVIKPGLTALLIALALLVQHHADARAPCGCNPSTP